jgi:tetratricopeptide (TPR) repeat protein
MRARPVVSGILLIIMLNVALTGYRLTGFSSDSGGFFAKIKDYYLFQYHYNAGLYFNVLPDEERACGHFRRALQLNPASARLRTRFVSVLHQQAKRSLMYENPARAEAYFSELDQVQPGFPPSALFFAGRAGSAGQALKLLERAQDIPFWKLAIETAKVITLRSHRMDTPSKLLDLYLANPSSTWIQIVAGDLYWMSGDFLSAQSAYRSALRANPYDYFLLLRLAYLLCIEFRDENQACHFFLAAFTTAYEPDFSRNAARCCHAPAISGPYSLREPLRYEEELLITSLTGFMDFFQSRIESAAS